MSQAEAQLANDKAQGAQSVTQAQAQLAADQSTLAGDNSTLSTDRATLTAAQQKEAIDCQASSASTAVVAGSAVRTRRGVGHRRFQLGGE